MSLRALAATGPTFTAIFERAQGGAWTVALAEEPNVHGSGSTLVEARANIREAIVTLFGPFERAPHGFDLVEDVRLPEATLSTVRLAREDRTRAQESRAAARAAEQAVAASGDRATEATLSAARLLEQHAALMNAHAGAPASDLDLRLPETLVRAVAQAQEARETAAQQLRSAQASYEAAEAISREAVVANRQAAHLLVDQCSLPPAEAGRFLGLSPRQVHGLLTD